MPPADYPPFAGPRLTLAQARAAGGGPVAGRLCDRGAWWLVDASDEVRVSAVSGCEAADGNWVSGLLQPTGDGAFALSAAILLAPRGNASPDPELPARVPLLRRRAAIVDAARDYFRLQEFLEVETPTRVKCPGLEPHLVAFPAGAERFLVTSPELHLKRLLAAGVERLVEFSRAFRDDERGAWHRSEFTLLEWYRAFADLAALEHDCERLVSACAAAPGIDARSALPGCDLAPPFDRVTVREALLRASGLDLAQLGQRERLARAVEARGHAVHAGDNWDELFFRVWIAEVEPGLGRTRPVFVHDYPASQAALARTRRTEHGVVAERFELYIDGIELANAFHELNDPLEQRRRHEADRAARAAAGSAVYPLDEEFLAALGAGMPPSAGIALGLDRLVALLCGAGSVDRVRAF